MGRYKKYKYSIGTHVIVIRGTDFGQHGVTYSVLAGATGVIINTSPIGSPYCVRLNHRDKVELWLPEEFIIPDISQRIERLINEV